MATSLPTDSFFNNMFTLYIESFPLHALYEKALDQQITLSEENYQNTKLNHEIIRVIEIVFLVFFLKPSLPKDLEALSKKSEILATCNHASIDISIIGERVRTIFERACSSKRALSENDYRKAKESLTNATLMGVMLLESDTSVYEESDPAGVRQSISSLLELKQREAGPLLEPLIGRAPVLDGRSPVQPAEEEPSDPRIELIKTFSEKNPGAFKTLHESRKDFEKLSSDIDSIMELITIKNSLPVKGRKIDKAAGMLAANIKQAERPDETILQFLVNSSPEERKKTIDKCIKDLDDNKIKRQRLLEERKAILVEGKAIDTKISQLNNKLSGQINADLTQAIKELTTHVNSFPNGRSLEVFIGIKNCIALLHPDFIKLLESFKL